MPIIVTKLSEAFFGKEISLNINFQFADILTGMVKLSQNGQPIFGTFVVEDEEEDYD